MQAKVDSLAVFPFPQGPIPEQVVESCLASASMVVGNHA